MASSQNLEGIRFGLIYIRLLEYLHVSYVTILFILFLFMCYMVIRTFSETYMMDIHIVIEQRTTYRIIDNVQRYNRFKSSRHRCSSAAIIIVRRHNILYPDCQPMLPRMAVDQRNNKLYTWVGRSKILFTWKEIKI